MRYWTKPIRIELDKEKVSLAKEFAKAVAVTTNYSDSNQTNRAKIEKDHFISKLGEEAVYQAYKLFTDEISVPDYTIYAGDNKSWDSDIIADGLRIAVKAQAVTAAERYGLSWTFQSSEKRTDPILKQPDNWVCFVECDDLHEYMCKIFPPVQIKALKFSEPVLEHLKGKKKVVYAKENF